LPPLHLPFTLSLSLPAVIAWCNSCATPRTFLRQRVESKLSHVLYKQGKFTEALALISTLLSELKKLDDKALLVETHLVESKIYHGLRNIPKSKAALTASRTAANAIYVPPDVQADIDRISGTLHCEEADYNTAHSYFLEAFEQLDQMDAKAEAETCLKYMMLCRILDSLSKALKLSSQSVPGAKVTDLDLSQLVSGKQAAKYSGRDLEAMNAIGKAASKRDLKLFEATIVQYGEQLETDLLVKHHLKILYEQLFESNLVRLVEPFSVVEIAHVAKLIDLDPAVVERKISQMILDHKLQGILDQGNGWLIVHERKADNEAMQNGVELITSVGKVVDNLYATSQRELMMK
jgi:26S proteasome regulatory subunit N6